MTDDDRTRDQELDPGAFIGRERERAAKTIPGGIGRRDERVAAHSTRSGPQRGPAPASTEGRPPEGHRDGPRADDDAVREAGERN